MDDRFNRKAPRRIAQAIISSLKGGVVPRVGLPYITVGREKEINAFLQDEEIIADGGASFRFIVGRYGSGKSFLLQTIRNYALDKNFVVVDADLSPERRLQGTHGQGLSTYKELIKNMSTKTKPEGGALSLILDRWINAVEKEVADRSDAVYLENNGSTKKMTADSTGQTESGTSGTVVSTASGTDMLGQTEYQAAVEKRIRDTVFSLNDMVHGFDFARLLTIYYEAYISGNDENKAKVIKWFRGEYSTKTEAKHDLGVNIIITDDDWYEYIKIFAAFLKKAGYSGMYILIDELVNIYKITNTVTRQNNYEKILAMYNDAMQGKAQYMGIIMCGTPECMEDKRRGVYSYEALRSRLGSGRFGGDHADLMAPVIRLEALSYEGMLVLTEKLSAIHADLYGYDQKVNDEDMILFLKAEFERVGADRLITPREVIRDYIELLDILYQEPELSLEGMLGSGKYSFGGSLAVSNDEDGAGDYAEFTI